MPAFAPIGEKAEFEKKDKDYSQNKSLHARSLILKIRRIRIIKGKIKGPVFAFVLAIYLSSSGVILPCLPYLLCISIFDAVFRIIPDEYLFLAVLSEALADTLAGDLSLCGYLTRFVPASAVIASGLLAAYICEKREHLPPFGFGDVKLYAAFCLMFPAGYAFSSIIYASVFCGLFAAAGLIFGNIKRTDEIAFGPFMTAALLFVLTKA